MWCGSILIRPSAVNGARFKTPAAQRVIPVHPELIKIGFLLYVEEVRQGGHDRLCPSCGSTAAAGTAISIKNGLVEISTRSGTGAEDLIPQLPPRFHRRAQAGRRHR
jgi:hypothetical protein